MRRLFVCAFCVAGLASAYAGQAATPAGAMANCGRSSDSGDLTRLAMIRKLLDTGHPYAALAHLDATGMKGIGVDDLRADALRRIGHSAEAQALYQGLLTTCLAGAGHHGLGLLAGEAGRLGESVDHLRQARLALPADVRVRSDLGYALLLSGDLEAAKFEFLTAQDLDPEDPKAALNLVLLFYRQGDTARAEAVAQRYHVGADELTRLRDTAAQLAPQQHDTAAQLAPQQHDTASQLAPQPHDTAAQAAPQQYDTAAQPAPQEYDTAAQLAPQQHDAVAQPAPQQGE
ncbi:MAG: hypothetical protein PHY45_00335 [Rhodocyclaceae bacterium]|nr:hypothetical protein [Rhodocyclaceae bacterium]